MDLLCCTHNKTHTPLKEVWKWWNSFILLLFYDKAKQMSFLSDFLAFSFTCHLHSCLLPPILPRHVSTLIKSALCYFPGFFFNLTFLVSERPPPLTLSFPALSVFPTHLQFIYFIICLSSAFFTDMNCSCSWNIFVSIWLISRSDVILPPCISFLLLFPFSHHN